MKWKLKKKNRWAREKQRQPEVLEVSPVDGCGCLWLKRILKTIYFSLEWKSEGVTHDDSGDSEEDEGEED